MGTSAFAEAILSSLLDENYNIISAYTRPDKKVGRDQEIQKSAVKITAENNKIPIYDPKKFDDDVIGELRNQKPDLIIVAAYGRILPKAVLEMPGFGAINVHTSLLPKYRGPSPIQNAILNGETETGATIMLMDEGIDTGDILNQKKIDIGKDEIYPELSRRLSDLSAELLLETIPPWIERKITPIKQEHDKATLCQLIERADGKILWSDDAKNIYDKFRAFQPWPGVYSFWEHNGQLKRIKLEQIGLMKNNSQSKHRLGEVFQIGEKIVVQTNSEAIALEEVQLEGKEKVKIEDFMNGYSNFIGSILK